MQIRPVHTRPHTVYRRRIKRARERKAPDYITPNAQWLLSFRLQPFRTGITIVKLQQYFESYNEIKVSFLGGDTVIVYSRELSLLFFFVTDNRESF